MLTIHVVGMPEISLGINPNPVLRLRSGNCSARYTIPRTPPTTSRIETPRTIATSFFMLTPSAWLDHTESTRANEFYLKTVIAHFSSEETKIQNTPVRFFKLGQNPSFKTKAF